MTPEQELEDGRKFRILLISQWAQAILLCLLLYVYVEACRQWDMEKIQKMIDSTRCTCQQDAKNVLKNEVNVGIPKTREDSVVEIVKSRDRAKLLQGDD